MKSGIDIKKLLIQAVKFIGLSGIGWLLDFTVYTVLGLFENYFEINNIISSCVGVTFVFIFSTRKIFRNEGKIPLWVKYLIYIAYQAVLIFLISKLIGVINTWITDNITAEIIVRCSHIISKIIVTPITMILNFIFMKILIERIK